jgi:hypothetical protein
VFPKEYKAKFEENDAKKAGVVSLNEIDKSAVELFKQIDTNNDGNVSLDGKLSAAKK